VSVYDDWRGIDDDAVLQMARKESRILVTNDKDFGDMVYRDRQRHSGVVLLRMDNESAASSIAGLTQLLGMGIALEDNFVVVTSKDVRVGPLPND
jgi:predicted nuclease of predicted toxin-antitoxin system